jgi:hypothetical protein
LLILGNSYIIAYRPIISETFTQIYLYTFLAWQN